LAPATGLWNLRLAAPGDNVTHRLAVVVPYRDRENHLKLFLPHMANHLTSQRIDYRILVVEQRAGEPFNRGKLLNVGFDLAWDDCDYFAFHDVDLLPVNADYSYPSSPTHLSARCSQFEYALPYDTYFGGVVLFAKEHFAKVNGYSNEYWGWGAEDDDICDRVRREGLRVERRPGQYTSLPHEPQWPGRINQQLYDRNVERLQGQTGGLLNHKEEGLSSLSYRIEEQEDLDFNARRYAVSI
jgi:hypothetical protein